VLNNETRRRRRRRRRRRKRTSWRSRVVDLKTEALLAVEMAT